MTASGHRNRTAAIVENIQRRGREVVREETRVDLAEGDRERIARLEGSFERLDAEVSEIKLALQSRPPANDYLPTAVQEMHAEIKKLREQVNALAAEAGARSRVPALAVVSQEVTSPAERINQLEAVVASQGEIIEALQEHVVAANELQSEVGTVLGLMGTFVEKIDSIAKQSADGHRIASDAMECIKIAAGARG